jgi:nitrogen fixation/metabolism regulation signal transduction histidine kinase
VLANLSTGVLAFSADGHLRAANLLVRGSRLPESTGGGYVVVFDDITS